MNWKSNSMPMLSSTRVAEPCVESSIIMIFSSKASSTTFDCWLGRPETLSQRRDPLRFARKWSQYWYRGVLFFTPRKVGVSRNSLAQRPVHWVRSGATFQSRHIFAILFSSSHKFGMIPGVCMLDLICHGRLITAQKCGAERTSGLA